MTLQDSVVAEERRTTDSIRIMFGVGGLIALILGILILLNPAESGLLISQIAAILIAVYMVVVGVVYCGTAIFSKAMKGWPRVGNALLGILYIIAGIILFSNITAAAAVLILFISIMIGVMWIIEGVVSFTTVSSSGHAALAVIYGIVSVLAGLVLIFVPLMAAFTLWLLLGIAMIVMGVIQIVRAFVVKSPRI